MIGIFDFFLLGGTFALGFYVFWNLMKFIENALKLYFAKRACDKSVARLLESLKTLNETLSKIKPTEKTKKTKNKK